MRERLEALRSVRLSRRELLWVALLFVMLMGVVGVWQLYGSAQEERDGVERLVRAQRSRVQRLRNIPDVESLRREQAELGAKLTSAEASFPARVDTVDLTNLFLRAGQKNGVELVAVQRADAVAEVLGKTSYQSVKYTVLARAPLESVSGFLKDVEEGEFATLRAEAIDLSSGEESWDVRFNVVVLAQSEATPTPSQ